MSTAAGADRDPGLQPERTRLAWRRTTLTGLVVTVLAVRASLHGGTTTTGAVAAALCLTLWLGFLALAHRRIRTLSATTRPAPLGPRHAAAVTLCTVGLTVCAVALVV
ncbi:DUF202 domain-containing protein [Streptomyces broussonetiae]|uniref:DUF202 domain-containing protein n=1 Tax=Streptomyces broussonetiae TaxID=2686304 RepID=A0ABV5E7B9_9ACTN